MRKVLLLILLVAGCQSTSSYYASPVASALVDDFPVKKAKIPQMVDGEPVVPVTPGPPGTTELVNPDGDVLCVMTAGKRSC